VKKNPRKKKDSLIEVIVGRGIIEIGLKKLKKMKMGQWRKKDINVFWKVHETNRTIIGSNHHSIDKKQKG
jgi:hypothetical protein